MANVREKPPRRSAPHLFGDHAGAAGARPTSRERDRHGLPAWLSGILIVLTCICLLATTLTLWTEATVLNTDRFVTLVGPLGRDPRVIDSVSRYVADQVVVALDIPGRTASALPARGQFLAGPLEQTVHDFVQTHTATLLSSDKMQATWDTIERSIHAELVAALRGQSSNASVANGVLSVNLLPLIAAALRQLQQAAPGFVPTRPPIPELSAAQTPAQQREVLSRALGIQLAPDFGVVALPYSDVLATAQRIVTALDILRVVLPIATLALAIAAIWTAADRRRAWLWLGIGTAVFVLVTILLISLLVGGITATVMAAPAQAIVTELVGILWADLQGLLLGILIASVLVALVAYLAGKPQWLIRPRSM